jgi:hypothetical protein
MATGNCVDCDKWALLGEGDAGQRLGLGRCENVPMFYEATQDPDSEDPADFGDAARVLKPQYQSVKALALDGSGYLAQLLTRADFGCVCFVPKPDKKSTHFRPLTEISKLAGKSEYTIQDPPEVKM